MSDKHKPSLAAKNEAGVETHDEDGNLTRAGMEAAINAGGSVSYKGRIISTIAGLPSPEDIAGTPEQREKAAADLERQIADLNARKAKLDAANKATTAPKK